MLGIGGIGTQPSFGLDGLSSGADPTAGLQQRQQLAALLASMSSGVGGGGCSCGCCSGGGCSGGCCGCGAKAAGGARSLLG